MNLNKADLQKEVSYKTSRSGGKGGQNVNKVSTKVELLFPIETSLLFTDEEKALLITKLHSRFNKDGLLQIVCDEERSQLLNKEIALGRLVQILGNALIVPKARKKVKISKAKKAARLDAKKLHSAKKESRRKDFGE
ncbi:alternative ribosome rescue aminoacyl-tRNA hydrolase ArfB [Mucilaginibacter boryungensis]|uniref:Aminoacyl-tRNA hydrolase n=1 Tax=Mucilaginibacter boryungensis TaxID=768480 RepID=A0ABR9XDV1_9SPHI|nr:alternative ribosome rescue aminoacyl-tRNA hydrolase ArfB [Mucilaginibacter boryungensis]MBE9665577.1 aminoacyl-tRNA hydrolase [Mucilaginibacter boryungensis]